MDKGMDGDAKGLKLRRKFVKLWRKFLDLKGSGLHYTTYNQTQPADLSNGHSFSRATSLPATTRFAGDQRLRRGQIKASGNCSNLLARTKQHIVRQLEKKTQNPPKDVPKGSVALFVGDEHEAQLRFVIPVLYFNHPLFLHLLEETEHVYGFDNKGVLTIPCQVSDFEYLRWLIERERERNQPWDLILEPGL